MGRWRIEMRQHRQVLVRMRHGDSERELACCCYMGRRKLAALRELAEQRGWLKPDAPLPDDAEIAAALGPPHKARSTVSGLEVSRHNRGTVVREVVTPTFTSHACRTGSMKAGPRSVPTLLSRSCPT